jgi:hypothetical protein
MRVAQLADPGVKRVSVGRFLIEPFIFAGT